MAAVLTMAMAAAGAPILRLAIYSDDDATKIAFASITETQLQISLMDIIPMSNPMKRAQLER